MVDFGKLRTQTKKSKPVEPADIFRRLPKPPGINDLYASQTEVLQSWFDRRTERDVVLKLHTGGGKTMVGLLIAQSTMNEMGGSVLYLTPTVQLAKQTIVKAKSLGIPAVAYRKGQDLDEDFVNGKAVMVGTYNALFNGKSRFRVRGSGTPQDVDAIILDDAHVAFSVIRDAFTLGVSKKEHRETYDSVTSLFRLAFKDTDRLGTFDDVVAGNEYSVLEVPYWAWHEKLDAVREILRQDAEAYKFEWPLLRDNLHLCHALVGRETFTITPIVPLVDLFPTFTEAKRRIYMSATIATDSEIIRTFDADPNSVAKPLKSRSLAGVSERMILIPDLMPFKFAVREAIETLTKWTVEKKFGAVVLVPSDRAADEWSEVATVAKGSAVVEEIVEQLQAGKTRGPIVFANRYDGMDLPGDACRLLVMSGLPTGTSDYDLHQAAALHGGTSIIRMLAQRIEQGIGRGARGSGDHCVVILEGADLAGWIAKDANFQMLTDATRAQMEMGIDVSKEVNDLKELATTIDRSFKRDTAWTEYHAEALAEFIDDSAIKPQNLDCVSAERKAINLWQDGHHQKAISTIEKSVDTAQGLDRQTKGWMLQLAARITHHWGNAELAESRQQQAYAENRNLLRPQVRPPYRPLPIPTEQATAIVDQISGYHIRRGFIRAFENAVAFLHDGASASQFEKALADLGSMIGFTTERHDIHGQGPDVLWLLPNKHAWIIEAKSRKKSENALSKGEHGQLLVAVEWFTKNYPEYSFDRVVMHPRNDATKAASADKTFALTYGNLQRLVSDARVLLKALCESQLPLDQLVHESNRLLTDSLLSPSKIGESYLKHFSER